jgi:hypothetical protein
LSDAPFFVFPAIWLVADWWHWASSVKFEIAFAAGVYLTSLIIIWLRIWGAYIERRLTEIEARVVDSRPYYYGSSDPSSDMEDFDRNPLFERLDRIERWLNPDLARLDRIEQLLNQEACRNGGQAGRDRD